MKRLILDLTPVPFDRPRFRLKRVFNSAKYAGFKRSAQILIRRQYHEPPLKGALTVNLLFMLEAPKKVKREYPSVRPDLDNYVKAVFDAGNDLLWNDDGQIVKVTASKEYWPKAGILIEVTAALR